MKQLYFLDEEEKNRILNLHESATKRQYLKEDDSSNQKNLPTITDNDKTYDYQKNGDTYFFKVKPNATDKRAQKYKDGNWHQGIGKASAAIKALFDKKPNGTQPSVKKNVKPVTNTDPSKAAVVTSKVAQTTPTTPVTTTPTTPVTTTPTTTTPATNTTQQPSGTNPSNVNTQQTGTVTLKVDDVIVK